MPGNGARNARTVAAVTATPMMTSVQGLIGPTPFPEGSIVRYYHYVQLRPVTHITDLLLLTYHET